MDVLPIRELTKSDLMYGLGGYAQDLVSIVYIYWYSTPLFSVFHGALAFCFLLSSILLKMYSTSFVVLVKEVFVWERLKGERRRVYCERQPDGCVNVIRFCCFIILRRIL